MPTRHLHFLVLNQSSSYHTAKTLENPIVFSIYLKQIVFDRHVGAVDIAVRHIDGKKEQHSEGIADAGLERRQIGTAPVGCGLRPRHDSRFPYSVNG